VVGVSLNAPTIFLRGELMKIRFTESHQTSFDGIHTVNIALNEVHDLPEEKAQQYIERGVAVLVTTPVEENKAIQPVQETKKRLFLGWGKK
jgi:hypothetical protein